MIYSGAAIKRLISQGKIKVEPQVEIKEASIKVHFSEKITLKPKEFLITQSKEHFVLSSDLAGLYDGYTHLARKGVITHLGSMFVDPGSNGQITLEIFNASDKEVIIEKGDRAGHLVILSVQN